MKELKIDDKDFRKIFISDTPTARFWKFIKRTSKQLLVLAVVYLFFFGLINFNAYWLRLQFSVTTVAAPEEPEIVEEEKVEFAPEIQIPKLGISAPLHMEIHPDLILDYLRVGVAHYAQTAQPGQIGNSVLVGHSSDLPWNDGNFKNIFALLDRLEIGDEILVFYGTERYVYKVFESEVVRPTQLSVLSKTDKPVLTLLTCYPVGTTLNRLIIRAELVSDNVSGVQARQPEILDSLPRPR